MGRLVDKKSLYTHFWHFLKKKQTNKHPVASTIRIRDYRAMYRMSLLHFNKSLSLFSKNVTVHLEPTATLGEEKKCNNCKQFKENTKFKLKGNKMT